jgi:hypothetical protein
VVPSPKIEIPIVIDLYKFASKLVFSFLGGKTCCVFDCNI